MDEEAINKKRYKKLKYFKSLKRKRRRIRRLRYSRFNNYNSTKGNTPYRGSVNILGQLANRDNIKSTGTTIVNNRTNITAPNRSITEFNFSFQHFMDSTEEEGIIALYKSSRPYILNSITVQGVTIALPQTRKLIEEMSKLKVNTEEEDDLSQVTPFIDFYNNNNILPKPLYILGIIQRSGTALTTIFNNISIPSRPALSVETIPTIYNPMQDLVYSNVITALTTNSTFTIDRLTKQLNNEITVLNNGDRVLIVFVRVGKGQEVVNCLNVALQLTRY